MSAELSVLNLNDDFQRVLEMPEAVHWDLKNPTRLEILATMRPAGNPVEEFQARLQWSEYPGDNAPSLKFRDPETGRLDLTSAWPKIRGFRPTSFDACVNYCAEGFALHPEWKNDQRFRWNVSGNVLLKVLRILQDEFDSYYEGRHP